MPAIACGVLALPVSLFLRRTRLGTYVYEIGDDPFGARTTGIPTRPVIVLQHVLAPKPGSLWRAMPGHAAAIVDTEGRELAPGEVGETAFRRPDPVTMFEYRRNPQATAKNYADDWLLTGDLGLRDDDGNFWLRGRADDIITCSGYRIRPGEIKVALNGHPAVAMFAVVGVPDPVTTESIRAYIVLRPGFAADAALADTIRESVCVRLAPHESPRTIEFVDALPMTATERILRRKLRAQVRRGGPG